MSETEKKSLPSNAYRCLEPGEVYRPVVGAEAKEPELTLRSVGWGVLFCVIFTVAAAYSGLKVGQVMESAIPISILAIGLARLYRRRSSLLENVIITGIGGVAGGVVAGAVFTVPALYILHLNPHPVQTIFICLAGGCLGVMFLIPLRRYFVREQHGLLPYPEATAITEVLVTGEKGGSQAKLLLQATAIAGVYDFFVTTFQVWKEYVDFRFVPVIRMLNERARMALSFDAVGFILGLGYVIGLRSSMILCAGGLLSNLVLVPLIWFVGSHLDSAVYPAAIPIAKMTAVQIYRNYVRFVGVGAIATAGIFGIVKSLRMVAGSFGIALRVFRKGEAAAPERTDRDISMTTILAGVVIGAIGVALLLGNLRVSLAVVAAGLLLTLVFSFFFTSVAANAIATTARNPVSGMTMLTIILSSAVLLRFGLTRYNGNVLCDGDCGNGVHGAFHLGTNDHGLEDGILAGVDAGGAGESKIPGSDRGGDCCRVDDRTAGAGVPIWGSSGGRFSAGAGIAAGVHHESAGGRIHEPPADRVFVIWNGSDDCGDPGNAGATIADFRAGDVFAAGAEYAGAGGRIIVAHAEQGGRIKREVRQGGG